MSDTIRAAYLADLTYRLAVDELDAQEPWEIWQRAWRAAQNQPAPPVPSTVQEILNLLSPYVRACMNSVVMSPQSVEQCEAAFKPLDAALTALVDDNHRLRFELDGVRAMRVPLKSDAGMADEYQRWIDFYHAGNGDYAEFLRRIEPEQGGNHG